MELQARFGIATRLEELRENLRELNQARINGKSEVELCVQRRITPLAIFPLAAYANQYNIIINVTDYSNKGYCDYLDVIGFPKGVTSLQSSEKSYLQMAKLHVDKDSSMLGDYEGRILSQVNMQKTDAKCAERFKFCVNTFTSELVDNVREHSTVSHYQVLAQYYPSASNMPCEIVIADNGRGYKESYEGTKYEVESDAKAIRNAVEGKSSASFIDNAWYRGEGIPIIANMFVKHFGGKLVFMSGESILYYKQDTTNPTEIELPFSWDGSMVCVNFYVKQVLSRIRDVHPAEYCNINK